MRAYPAYILLWFRSQLYLRTDQFRTRRARALERAAMAWSSKSWLRVAGVSGASAVILGTYGAHAFHPKDHHYLATFETANKYHFIHSLLIGLAPSARLDPMSILFKPCQLFSYHAFVLTRLHSVQKATPRRLASNCWRRTLLRKVSWSSLQGFIHWFCPFESNSL